MKILLQNGMVYTMQPGAKPGIADILIQDGLIRQVAPGIPPDDAQIIDCTGKAVLPGLIDSHCHIGLFGTAMGERGVDGNESSHACTPHLRGIDGLNPFDPEFQHARQHGVTCVSTGPGSANPICGQFVTLKTHGATLAEMILQQPSAMKMAFGENPKCAHDGAGPLTRMGTAAIIREALLKAKRYAQDVQTAQKNDTALPPLDFKLEALIPVVQGELPVKAHAHRADDILTALRIANEFGLKISIEHCSEGHLIPTQLAGASGVILGPLLGFPHKLEVANQSPAAAAILHSHGVKFALMSDLPASHCADIILAAGACVRAGLPMLEGLRALTLNPAEILGIAHQTGSLQPGKHADIAVFTANPLEYVQSSCVLTIVSGVIVHNQVPS